MGCRVLSFHYVLTNDKGEVLDSSRNTDPFQVMEGKQQIIPVLEEALLAMSVGEKKQVHVPADLGYGPVHENLRIKVNRGQLPPENVKVGTQFTARETGENVIFTITKIEGEEVFLDGNHPLAGVDLNFDVEVMAVREATAEEQEHGHAHGEGGHHH